MHGIFVEPIQIFKKIRRRPAVSLGAAAALALGVTVGAQDTLPLVESRDTRHYDFWIGRWVVVKDGKTDPGGITFTVSRSVHPGALEEVWSGAVSARALRAWDKTTSRWMYVWISDNALFQVWEGRKVGSDWYMFREFDIGRDRYLSRQAVLSTGPDSAVRISERSSDGGATWQLRFKENLRKINE